MVCPQYPEFSYFSASPLLSDKRLYPLFFRYIMSYSITINSMISHISYFGWTKVGMLAATSSTYPVITRGHNVDLALLQGVTIYDPTGPATWQFYQAWYPRFINFVNFTLTNEPGLYYDLNPSETDPTAQDYPANLFLDAATYPAIVSQASYDATMVLANVWENLIVEHGTTGEALANGSLTSFVTMDKISAQVASVINQSLLGIHVSHTGDAIPSMIVAAQIRGFDPSNYFFGAAGIYVNLTTGDTYGFYTKPSWWIWQGNANRSFYDIPIDYPKSFDDYVDWKSVFTRAVHYVSIVVGILCLVITALFVHYIKKAVLLAATQGVSAHLDF
eukprot:jgi/Hompol1/5889/HPOL_002603-RA